MDAWLTTYTGKKFYPANPNPDDINIFDIAHALAMTCRYGGHCDKFYSVAEHSVRLSEVVSIRSKLSALLDDSAEAYLGDMPSRIKHLLFPEYVAVEAKLREAILKKLNVTYDPAIKYFESRLLAAEVRDLGIDTDGWDLPYEPLKEKIVPWSWVKAQGIFLRKFHEYRDAGR